MQIRQVKFVCDSTDSASRRREFLYHGSRIIHDEYEFQQFSRIEKCLRKILKISHEWVFNFEGKIASSLRRWRDDNGVTDDNG